MVDWELELMKLLMQREQSGVERIYTGKLEMYLRGLFNHQSHMFEDFFFFTKGWKEKYILNGVASIHFILYKFWLVPSLSQILQSILLLGEQNIVSLLYS